MVLGVGKYQQAPLEHVLLFENIPKSTLMKTLKLQQGGVCPCYSALPHAVTGDGTMFSRNFIHVNTSDYTLLDVYLLSFSLD